MTRTLRLTCLAASGAVAATLAGAALAGAEAPPRPDPEAGSQPEREFVTGEVLARFRGDRPQREYDLPPGVGVRAATRALRSNPNVRWAVPNYVARASAPWIPNDRGRKSSEPGDWQSLQWNFLPCGGECGEKSGDGAEAFGGIDAPGAWDNLRAIGKPGAKGVKVAVVDTGVAYRGKGRRFRRSPDLKRQQWKQGRDFVDDDKLALDENGHGTHVASTIAERTNNGKFATGLAYRARMVPVRVLDRHGEGGASDVARGIRYAARKGAKVINLSLEFARGAVESCDDVPSVCSAIERAHDKGALVVSVSGNTERAEASYPGRAPRALATGATTIRGCLADYSAYGRGLDFVAPGGGEDTFAGPHCKPLASGPGIAQITLRKPGVGNYRKFGYRKFDGTSMASAHAAGVAALAWASLRDSLGRKPSPDEVTERLKSTARSDDDLADSRFYGAGLLDAEAATSAPSL